MSPEDLPRLGYKDKACGVCGWRFFTTAALADHRHSCRPRKVHPALRAAGLRIAALNNARRRRCDTCGHVSTPPALGMHQKARGHAGWTEAT